MTETHVLIAGFLIVFGFGGYKLANLIKNFLDKYSSNIAGRIHESEQLKLKAVIAFDEINKRAESINDKVVEMKTEVNQQIGEKRYDQQHQQGLPQALENVSEHPDTPLCFIRSVNVAEIMIS